MKSNVCKIEKGTKDLEAIFQESEKVAVYNGLTDKQAMELRLLCEEIDGMLPNIIEDFEGTLWIEFEDGVCKVNVSIEMPTFEVSKKEELIDIIAFAEIFNEFDGLPFAGEYRGIADDKARELRALHEKELDKLKKAHPDILFAFDTWTPRVNPEISDASP